MAHIKATMSFVWFRLTDKIQSNSNQMTWGTAVFGTADEVQSTQWTDELVVSVGFSSFALSVRKQGIAVPLVAADGPVSVYGTPLFPQRVCGLPLPIICCSVFAFKPCHPMVECQRECKACAQPACLHTTICMCVCSGVVVFFSYWSRISCGYICA